jgi:hypothetical protein
MHANHLARNVDSERMQTILQWVGVGSVIMMGAAAAVHLFKDLWKPQKEWQREPFPAHRYREMQDDLDRKNERQERGR